MPTKIFRICSSEVADVSIGEVGTTGVVAGVGLVLLVVTTGGTTGVLPVSLRMLKSMDLETDVEAKMVGRSLESWAQRQSNKLLESSM